MSSMEVVVLFVFVIGLLASVPASTMTTTREKFGVWCAFTVTTVLLAGIVTLIFWLASRIISDVLLVT